MGGRSSKDRAPVEGPIVDVMRDKWGEESLNYLHIWAGEFGFPPSGSFSLQKIGLLEERLREKESRAKVKVNVKKIREIKKQRGCLKMWRDEAELKARVAPTVVDSHTGGEENQTVQPHKRRAPHPPPLSSLYPQLDDLKLDPDLDLCPPALPPIPPRKRERHPAPLPGGHDVSPPGASTSPRVSEDRQTPPVAGTMCGHPQVRVDDPEGPPLLYRPRTPGDMFAASADPPSPPASGSRITEEPAAFRLAIPADDVAGGGGSSGVGYSEQQVDKRRGEESRGAVNMAVVTPFMGVGRGGRGPGNAQGHWSHDGDSGHRRGRWGLDGERGGPDREHVRAGQGSAQHTHSCPDEEHTHAHGCNQDWLGLPARHSEETLAADGCSDQADDLVPISSLHMSEGSQKRPEHPIIDRGQSDVFLVDSAVPKSVVKPSEFSPLPEMSRNGASSVHSSGQNIAEPLSGEDGLRMLDRQFLLTDSGLNSVTRRDPISKPGQLLLSTPGGGKVHKSHEPESNLTHPDGQGDLLWVYQWKLQHLKLSSDLLAQAALLVSPIHTDFMTPGDLHCTSHLSAGRDELYERSWLPEKPGELELTHLYWDQHRCAVSVSLTPRQQALYLTRDSSPHVSLAKSSGGEWKDLGPFVKSCQEASDWQETPDAWTSFSPSLRCQKRTLASVAYVRTTVQLVTECYTFLCVSLALPGVPETLWAVSEYSVGLIKGCKPVVITSKFTDWPRTRQHPRQAEASECLRPFLDSLREEGVIVPCAGSPVCSPLREVKKSRDGGRPPGWRMVLDLRVVNAAVRPRKLEVPTADTILSQVPPGAAFFSVVDLTNASFSVPVHPDSQYLFAFRFEGRLYTFTRLPQGYCETSAIYHDALRRSLEPLALGEGTALLQCIDDLMVCSPTRMRCEADTVKLLKHLAAEGHKAQLSKLQFVQRKVTYLGHAISAEGRSPSAKRVQAIQDFPTPLWIKDLKTFLGMCSSCRTFIPNYAAVEAPLSALVDGDQLTWTPQAEESFAALKSAVLSAATLRVPAPGKPFTQVVDSRDRCMTSVLLQEHGGEMKPVAYFSAKLDGWAARLPRCLQAVAAAEKAEKASRRIVGSSQLTLLVPHDLSSIAHLREAFPLATASWPRFTGVPDKPNVTVKRCSLLNPATLLPSPGSAGEHDCADVLQRVFPPRPDLNRTPLTKPDRVLFADGWAPCDGEENGAAFVVTSDGETLASGPLPPDCPAGAAELTALTWACRLAEGQKVTIYTGSRYAFRVVHDFAALWKDRAFLRSSGAAFPHNDKAAALLDALLLPKSVAVCEYRAVGNVSKRISEGNARARKPPPEALPPASAPLYAQTFAAAEEDAWRAGSARRDDGDGVWRGPDGNPCLPKHFFPHFAKLAHGSDHWATDEMFRSLSQSWFTTDFSAYAEAYCRSCAACAAAETVCVSKAPRPMAEKPFDHLMVEFIELTPSQGMKYCLVVVDEWSKWVEAFPAKQRSSQAVAKALVAEIIPRWGIPAKISSDQGALLIDEAIQQAGEFLGVDLARRCVYRAAGEGAGVQGSRWLKTKLDRWCEETGLPWLEALPFVLMQMRLRKRPRINLSPFEILFGRPPRPGAGPAVGLPACTGLCEHDMLEYCRGLSSQTSRRAGAASPLLHDLRPGDMVVVKEVKKKRWRQGGWAGPYQVLLVAHTEVKVAGMEAWIHASRCNLAPAGPAPAW